MDTPDESRFRAVLEAAPDAMLTVDADGRITMVNSETERLFGYRRDELIGTPIEILLPESLRATHVRYRAQYQRQPKRRPMGHGLDLVARRKDGSEFPTEISLSPLHAADGLSVIVAVRDITERKRAETERAALAREQEAHRAKDEFVAMVSHELRTPLNAILGWATLLQEQQPGPDVLHRGLAAIERNARVQRQVIDDLLEISTIANGKVALEMRELDLGEVIEAAEESVKPAAEARRITLDVAIERPLPRIRGDARRLQQVCWNLLSNAVKFTPEGGSVKVNAGQAASGVELSVADNGIGIDPAFLPFVFDRFRQLDSSTERKQRGLGLGLAIVRELVELHGGRVHVESEGEGRGTTFTVRLPSA
jgi:protein-histidine pros-kinase